MRPLRKRRANRLNTIMPRTMLSQPSARFWNINLITLMWHSLSHSGCSVFLYLTIWKRPKSRTSSLLNPCSEHQMWFWETTLNDSNNSSWSLERSAARSSLIRRPWKGSQSSSLTYPKALMAHSSLSFARANWQKNPNRASLIHIRSAIKKSEPRFRLHSAEKFLMNIKKSI